MPEDALDNLKSLVAEFGDLSLNDFRDALQALTRDTNPTLDRYIVEQLKNFRGNRTMRAEMAAVLAEREDEGYIDDFALVIEKETDVGLCKECINGLVRIGAQESIQKLEFLAKSKPNATISSLLRRELDKLRHEEKEPAAYYLEHLAHGNKNLRACRNAAKVLVKLGDPKAVDQIIEAFDDYDDLARAEGAKVISQLGQPDRLAAALKILEKYRGEYSRNKAFVDTLEGMEQEPKEKRVGLMTAEARPFATPQQEPYLEQFFKALEDHRYDAAELAMNEALEIESSDELSFYLESLALIGANKVAHAQQLFEERLRRQRTRHSRLRHLVAQLAYGVGKIGSHAEASRADRVRAVNWLEELAVDQDNDIAKMALYGASFIVQPEDKALLAAVAKATQIEGMTRLITALSRRSSSFSDFFLKIATSHEILDIQELAMSALGGAPEIYPQIREMLADASPDIRLTGIRIIGEVKAEEFQADLTDLLEGQSDIIRVGAIAALGKLGKEESLAVIDSVMADAKSPALVETGLQAIADIGGPQAIELLKGYVVKARQRKSQVAAVRLLVESYRSWRAPLPDDLSQMVFDQLKSWFEERDPAVRREAYAIAGALFSYDLALYESFKALFKEAISRLRSQAVWDKEEMAHAEQCLRTLNRNFFFLKEMQEFRKNLSGLCRTVQNPSLEHRIAVYEKIIAFLNANARFVLSEANEKELEALAFHGLEEGEASWREQDLVFQIAGYANSDKLRAELSGRVKSAPVQARASLLEALARMGMSLQDLNELTSIRNILVLDGSGFFRKRLIKFLEGEGFRVRDAENLDLAEAAIAAEKPDLVLTELTFKAPGDGVDFIERMVKQHGGRIQWVISTNTREATVVQRMARLKPKRILFKPYPPDKLKEAIQS